MDRAAAIVGVEDPSEDNHASIENRGRCPASTARPSSTDGALWMI